MISCSIMLFEVRRFTTFSFQVRSHLSALAMWPNESRAIDLQLFSHDPDAEEWNDFEELTDFLYSMDGQDVAGRFG